MTFTERVTPLCGKLTVKKDSSTKVQGHRFKIPSYCTPTPFMGNRSVDNHRLGPYSYRIHLPKW